jgi:hypothetical protein
MRITVVFCLLLNLAVILVCGALLKWYPSQQGFTLTTSRATHYFSGGVLPSALLLCLLDTAIAIYLAWSLWHVR